MHIISKISPEEARSWVAEARMGYRVFHHKRGGVLGGDGRVLSEGAEGGLEI